MSDLSPAEANAQRNGWPTVLVTATELLRVAEGNPIVVVSSAGQSLLLRLPTVEEFTEAALAAGAESVDRELAERAVRPLAAPTFP